MSGLHILFWNMYRKDLSDALASILEEHEPTIVLLCEYVGNTRDLLNAVNRKSTRYRLSEKVGESRLIALTTLGVSQFTRLRDEDRYSFWRVATGPSSITLCGVHLQSAMGYDKEELSELVPRLRRDLEEVEAREGNHKSILMGDFNLDPFDRSFTSSEGLSSVSSLRLARRKEVRRVANEKRRVLYNPMWSHLGDRPTEPEGTYFRSTGVMGYGWRMFDQVLFCPSVIDMFHEFEVEILKTAGNNDLVNDLGRPDSKSASDHLPIRIHFFENASP